MSFYVVKGGTLDAVGEYADLKGAEKSFSDHTPGSYDIVKVVRVGVVVAEVPATKRVIGGASTVSRPRARGPRKGDK